MGRKLLHPRIRARLALLALMVVLSACGSGSTRSSTGGPTPPVSPAVSTSPPTPGLSAIAIVRYDQTVTASTHPLTVTATCRGSEQMLSGGFTTDRYFPDASYPSSPSAWTVRLDNTNSVPLTLTAVVVCLHAPFSPATTIQTAAASVPLGAPTHAVAACPAGSVVTGGGFATTITDRPDGTSVSGAIVTSKPTATGWDTANYTATATSETAYTVCAAAHITAASPVTTSLSTPNGMTTSDSVSCPTGGGQVLIGGGWDETAGMGGGVAASLLTSDRLAWEVTTHAGFGVDQTTAIYGICALIS